ncbi:MAG: hypothetical protein RSD40_03145 [Bacilli bacterium]
MILGKKDENGNNFKSFNENNSFNSFNFTMTINEDSYLESLDKALNILKERYEKKAISLDEFTKQAKELGKKKETYTKNLNK